MVSGYHTIPARGRAIIQTGIRVAIPPGYFGWIASRSGLAAKGVTVEGGIIDSGYRGELGVIAYNHNPNAYMFGPGQKVAQLIIIPYVQAKFEPATELPESERGEGGFGSTGA